VFVTERTPFDPSCYVDPTEVRRLSQSARGKSGRAMRNPPAVELPPPSVEAPAPEEPSETDDSLAEYARSERISNYLQASIFSAMVVTLTVILFYARF
jgi:hypothetical protein